MQVAAPQRSTPVPSVPFGQQIANRASELSQNLEWAQVGSDELHLIGDEPRPMTMQEMLKATVSGPALAADPAHGGHIGPGNIEEAAVGVIAEHLGTLSDLKREPTGISEFTAPDGKTWDVKSPLSPGPGQHWQFDCQHQLVKIRHDFSENDHVLLNLSRCNTQDSDSVVKMLESQLKPEERPSVMILLDKSEVPQAPKLSSV